MKSWGSKQEHYKDKKDKYLERASQELALLIEEYNQYSSLRMSSFNF